MQSSTLHHPVNELENKLSNPLWRAIGYAGLVVGVLDATDGVAYFGLTAHLIRSKYCNSSPAARSATLRFQADSAPPRWVPCFTF